MKMSTKQQLKTICYFITGSSGVGKSAVLPLLKKLLGSKYDVHDFDEKLTKKVAMNPSLVESWQQETIAFWKKKAQKNWLNKKGTVILGLVYPNEVVKIQPQIHCECCFLDASQEVLTKRLMKHRFSNAQKRKNLLQATGKTPQQFIIENTITIDRLRTETIQLKGCILDTSKDTIPQTAEKIRQWITT